MNTDTLPSIVAYAKDPLVARWAVLMLCVRAENDHRRPWMIMQALSPPERQVILTECPGPRSEIEDQLGSDRVQTLIEQGVLRVQDGDEGLEMIEVEPSDVAEVTDVLLMLEPAPKSLLMYFAAKKSATGKWIRKSDQVTLPLKRLGSSPNGWGRWSLNIDDVLSGRPFDCPLCRTAIQQGADPPPSHKTENQEKHETYSHGLRSGEGLLLRLYAEEIGFEEYAWPTWLACAP